LEIPAPPQAVADAYDEMSEDEEEPPPDPQA
jgi:hypothetical protein